jgi:hypothetical protein
MTDKSYFATRISTAVSFTWEFQSWYQSIQIWVWIGISFTKSLIGSLWSIYIVLSWQKIYVYINVVRSRIIYAIQLISTSSAKQLIDYLSYNSESAGHRPSKIPKLAACGCGKASPSKSRSMLLMNRGKSL